jgi:CheY-like chemotaxis protein
MAWPLPLFPKQMGNASNVLVVDDDRDTREFLAEFLVFEGYAVHSATNGFEALEWLETLRLYPN